MMELRLICLGKVEMTLGDEPLTAFATEKMRALLVYLAVEERVHTRSELVQLLWPGYITESANNNLRQALHRLRHLRHDEAAPWLLITRQTVQINPAAPLRVDVTTFTRLLAECSVHRHNQIATCQPCLTRLRQAVNLYQGDFLAGFTLVDSDAFEEWRRITQEQLHLQVIDALTQLAHAAESNGDVDGALHAAQRQVALEPWLEAAHRQIMRLLAHRGQRAAALAQYSRCRQVLAEELGAEPDAATAALYEQIQRGDFDKKTRSVEDREPEDRRTEDNKTEDRGTEDRKTEGGRQEVATAVLPPFGAPADTGLQASSTPLPSGPRSSALPVFCSALYDWGEMPVVDFFAGRRAEVAQVTAWLASNGPTMEPPVQVVSLLGLGGIGKTTLAAAAVKAVAPTFTVVIWRSLLNAPPLSELLRNWLQLLARQTLTAPPDTLDEQLRLLLTHLRQERCLLVLDNVESIFAAAEPHGRAGAARPGYEGYEQLFQRLASSEHQSCLLLTSREQPDTLTRLPGGRGRLRVLTLSGLDQQAGYELLQSNGLDASAQEAAQLVDTYSGNPLALQIVASAIADFFGGDVLAFQQAEGGLFDGIRLVLDQQFARLSPLEREILLWLAIEREAVPVATLRSNLVEPRPEAGALWARTARLLEALHALQNRSLLEKRDAGLTLQNVVMEYTTEYLVTRVCEEILDSAVDEPPSAIQSLSWKNPKSNIQNVFLNRFALLKAQAKAYVRQSQARLLLQPVAERLTARLGKAQVAAHIAHLLDRLRAGTRQPGYAAGNLLNLLIQLGVDLAGYDFSQLTLWQADLRGVVANALNLVDADLSRSAFTLTFQNQAIKFHPSGALLVAGTIHGDFCLWQAVDGQLTDVVRSPGNGGYPMVFSADGQFVAGAGRDFVIQLWSTVNGAPLQRLHGHTSRIHALALSPAGTLLASSSGESAVLVWDLRRGRICQRLEGHFDGVGALAFSPDGHLLATGDRAKVVRLWQIDHPAEAGQLCKTFHGHTHEIAAFAFTPDGARLAAGGHDGVIWLWNLHTPEANLSVNGPAVQVLEGHQSIIRALLFHPHPTLGYQLASGSADKTVRLWSPTGQLLYTLVGHTHEVEVLTSTHDGRVLASSGYDQKIYLWDPVTGQMLNSLQAYQQGIESVRFSPTGQMLASGAAGRIVLWQVAPGQTQPAPAAIMQFARFVQSRSHLGWALAFSPTGRLLVGGDAEQHVRLWEVATGQEVALLQGNVGLATAVAFSPDGAWLAVAGSDHQIQLWRLTDERPERIRRQDALVGHTAPITTLTFSQDSCLLLSSSNDYTTRIWDLTKRVTQHILTGHTSAVSCAALSPDGSTVATISFDCTIRLWDRVTGQCLLVRKAGNVGDRAVAFSPDGAWLAYGGADFAVYLWAWRTDAAPYALTGHTNIVMALDFSPAAPLLISCGMDSTLRLWDLASRSCRQLLHAPGPYAGMQITGVTGISAAQKASLRALGAVEE